MIFSIVIRRCLLPAAAVVAETKLTSSNKEAESINKCRPSELPIYTPEPPTRSQEEEQEHVPNVIENSIKSVRQTWARYSDEINAYEKVARQSLDDSKKNVEWLIDYLRKEDNTLPKAGAIGIGALTGLIFGLRGGFFKRTIYATTGGLGMAAVCYPKEASEYTKLGLGEGKKILTIAYNFVYGDSEVSIENTKNTINVSSENLKNAVLIPLQDSTESTSESQVVSDEPNTVPEIEITDES